MQRSEARAASMAAPPSSSTSLPVVGIFSKKEQNIVFIFNYFYSIYFLPLFAKYSALPIPAHGPASVAMAPPENSPY